LILLFNTGAIEAHSKKSNFSYVVSGKESCYKLYVYFDKYLLKTKKLNSYILWKQIHKQICNKDHLNPDLREKLILKAKQINSTKRKSQ
jgi:hypothetical protein